ncbi:hypothetical protein TRICI_003383 [Trichomonascus ciferrii]|uniref:TRIP4/RQT4 C2HC5-type zinc finger domain-containing protein n=1 Tax=Trichomonascus ciferrii TaxID=44093 RepID=A0A642V417_9ASCO|nr:hypothetical protein TRICI_003383 [Trichomonascus ciferrii]
MAERLAKDLREALQLDDESLSQVVEHAESLEGKQLETFLSEFLGPGSDVTRRYLEARKPPQPTINVSSPSTSTSTSAATSRSSTPAGPRGQPSGLRYTKGVWEAQPTKKQMPKKASNNAKSSSSKNKVKVDDLSDIDAALKQLELNSGSKVRKPCNCMASRHPLLEVAPNCLNCGKIVCAKEGLGPCTFCGEPLISNEHLREINQVLQSEKEALASSMGKKAKQKAGVDMGTTVSTLGLKNFGSSDALNQAEGRLNQLLEYQDTAAQRTKIIDQVSDFETPDAGVNRWASPMEQAQQLKRQQKQLRKLEEQRLARSGRGKKVISIDLKGNKVYAEEHDAEPSSDDEDNDIDQEEVSREQKKQPKPVTKWEPSNYGKNFIKPQYRESKKKKPSKSELNINVDGGIVDNDDDETRALEL